MNSIEDKLKQPDIGADFGGRFLAQFLDDFRGGPASLRWERGTFSRSLFAIHARLLHELPPYRIRESSLLSLMVSQLLLVWFQGEKSNNYNSISHQLTIEWE